MSKLANSDAKSILESPFNKEQFKKSVLGAFKGNVGHTSQGSGGVETILAIEAMNSNTIPKIRNLVNPCDSDLSFSTTNQKKDIEYMVKTASGFGIINGAMLMKKL